MNTTRQDIFDTLYELMGRMPTYVEFRAMEQPEGLHVVVDVKPEQLDEIIKQFGK